MATKSASFIENINTLANATSLATGDVVEDTNLAKEEALAAAAAALVSETNAAASETNAEDWSNKGHNNPVAGTIGVDAEYSAYHWKTEAEILIGDPVIDDNLASATKTYSSEKITTITAALATSTHNHDSIYEAKFLKNTAFNKNFGTGATDVPTGNHNHDTVYEPLIGTKSTGFNKDLGIVAGTVAEGNHTHDYEPTFTKNTAFNKNFVVDTANPTADEVPRGTHIHPASGISYDNTGNSVITSTTAQGAIQQLDSSFGIFEVTEKCYGTVVLDGVNQTTTITTASTPVKLGGTTKTGGTVQNITTPSSNNFTIAYPTAPVNLIEGRFSATVAVQFPSASTELALTAYKNGAVINADWSSDISNVTLDGATTGTLSLDGFLTGLVQGDYIELYISNNTNTNDIVVNSVVMVFDGAPQGALISSGITIAHTDVTARDTADSHPVSAITGLVTELAGKSDTTHTHLVADVTDLDLTTKADKAVPLAAGNIATLDVGGNLTDSTVALTDKADVGGTVAQIFHVGDATLATHAVNKGQVDALATTYTTLSTFNTHEAAANPHATTASDVGAAETVHTHVVADTTGLQTELDAKYVKVATPVTGNLPRFAAGDVLEDSGFAIGDLDTDTLVDLTDTTIVTPLDGQTLQYDNGTSKWINATPVTGVTDHALLTNIGTVTHTALDSEYTVQTRVDRVIQKKNITGMAYNGGTGNDKLSTITYTDTYTEDLVYNVSDQLEFIDHKLGGVVQGYTTLGYTVNQLTSYTYTDGVR